MQELITITEQNGEKAVSARELHQFLGVQTKFAEWITRRISEYGFVENQDYILISQNWETKKGQGGDRRSKEYAISLDMAKELSMVERTEKGKQARRYFIEVEKSFRVKTLQVTPQSQRQILQKQKMELVDLIRENLRRGDITQVCRENGFSLNQVKNVMRYDNFRPDIVKALYDKALTNKNKMGGELQQMINELKK